MVKTRSQTEKLDIKKEEEEEDRKPTLLLHSGSDTRAHNKVAKRKPTKGKDRRLRTQQIKVEEDTDIKSLLQSTPKYLKSPKRQRKVSQEQINQLIDHVVNHGMSVSKASCMVNMSYNRGLNYYKLYKNDSEKKIPAPRNRSAHPPMFSTQEQIKNLVKYINNDKMTLSEASAKANMNYESGRRYYNKYLKDPNHNIPIPRLCQYYTQDQKNEFIGYIVNDKMNIKEASLKAKMNIDTGKVYYHKYFDVQNPDLAKPSHITSFKHLTQEQIKEVIHYIVSDKMTIVAASRKVNIDPSTAGFHYRQYLKDNNMEPPMLRRYTQDEINKVLGYIVDDKMTVKAASKKANISYQTGRKYYMEYRKKHNLDPPALKYRQDKIKEIAGYVIDEKMSVKAAAKKANVKVYTGQRYYRKYLMDKKRDASS